MSEHPDYSIGIDLGTTNCALALVALDGTGESSVLPVPQRSDLHLLVERDTLPSFLYRPTEAELAQLGGDSRGCAAGWLLGLAARQRVFAAPDRVAHSSKSWLCQHSISPEAPLLPWRSEAVAASDKLSPLAAATCLLTVLREAWDGAFGPTAPLGAQAVTIAVPASFDLAAQRATLEAAWRAGYPATTRLLEEPQAAFYRWLEQRSAGGGLRAGQRVLVVDVGGGTSDFCLFEVTSDRGLDLPAIERIAVSDHILLGGDNIDLALAHALEPLLAGGGEELGANQWSHLVAQARALKERCLVDDSPGEDRFAVAIPARGSGLLAGTLSATIAGGDVRRLLLDGFFPECPLSASPERGEGGLQEWGLPYAADCAVTRHLAEFVRVTGGRIDAVLFNGGTLRARLVRDRIIDQLARWQSGHAPVCLDNAEPDLAVARGAAYSGALAVRHAPRIASGLARALYLSIGDTSGAPRLLCALPRGAPPEVPVEVALPGLALTTNRTVRFEAWQGEVQGHDSAGTVRSEAGIGFSRLPTMETRIDSVGGAAVPVRLRSTITETGILRVECRPADPNAPGTWLLEFNTRDAVPGGASPTPVAVGGGRLASVLASLREQVLVPAPKASKILARIEALLGRERAGWTLPELRQIADVLLALQRALDAGDVRAECWLHLVGYAMRPGFGAVDDEPRMERLWERVSVVPAAHPRRVEVQELVLWRRVAGGLSSERQLALLERHWAGWDERTRVSAERIRLLGALEKVPVARKSVLVDWCLREGLRLVAEGGYAAPCFAALGQLLGRAPFRAGPEQVLPPEVVIEAFDRLRGLDWRSTACRELVPAFLGAARIVDDRRLDLPGRALRRIWEKLEDSGASRARLGPLLEFRPLTRAEQSAVYGEALPLGLSFA